MPFRDYILDRFWLKLFSFILATLIWFTVQSKLRSNAQPDRPAWNPFRSVETREVTRQVRLVTLPTTRRFFRIEPVEVHITIKGKPRDLDRLNPSDIQAQVNLTDASDSAATYFVEARNVPRTVEIVQIVPAAVMVEPRAN